MTTSQRFLKQTSAPRELGGGEIDPWLAFTFGQHDPLSDKINVPEDMTWDKIISSIGLETQLGRQLKSDNPSFMWFGPSEPKHIVDVDRGLSDRLGNANTHFRRKASEVVNDNTALGLLSVLYNGIVVDLSHIDAGTEGVSLAKLAAANFCEIGAKIIYITDAGIQFMDSLPKSYLVFTGDSRGEATPEEATEL